MRLAIRLGVNHGRGRVKGPTSTAMAGFGGGVGDTAAYGGGTSKSEGGRDAGLENREARSEERDSVVDVGRGASVEESRDLTLDE